MADARIQPEVSARVEEALQRQRKTNRECLARAQGWYTQLRSLLRDIEEPWPDEDPSKLENLVRYAGDEAGEICKRLRDSIDHGRPQ